MCSFPEASGCLMSLRPSARQRGDCVSNQQMAVCLQGPGHYRSRLNSKFDPRGDALMGLEWQELNGIFEQDDAFLRSAASWYSFPNSRPGLTSVCNTVIYPFCQVDVSTDDREAT